MKSGSSTLQASSSNLPAAVTISSGLLLPAEKAAALIAWLKCSRSRSESSKLMARGMAGSPAEEKARTASLGAAGFAVNGIARLDAAQPDSGFTHSVYRIGIRPAPNTVIIRVYTD